MAATPQMGLSALLQYLDFPFTKSKNIANPRPHQPLIGQPAPARATRPAPLPVYLQTRKDDHSPQHMADAAHPVHPPNRAEPRLCAPPFRQWSGRSREKICISNAFEPKGFPNFSRRKAAPEHAGGAPSRRRSGRERIVLAGVPFPPVAELQTAECTVVEGRAEKLQYPAERVAAHSVDMILRGQPGEFARAALRAFGVAPEDPQQRAPHVEVLPAVLAAVDGAAEDLLEKVAPLPDSRLPASGAAWHRWDRFYFD